MEATRLIGVVKTRAAPQTLSFSNFAVSFKFGRRHFSQPTTTYSSPARGHKYHPSSPTPQPNTSRFQSILNHNSKAQFTTNPINMSFSNADTGSKTADPYKAKNKDEPGVEEKVTDLTTFIGQSKFGMMTTRSAEGGLLVSRCMALAASEAGGLDLIFHTNTESGKTDDLEKDSHINMSFLNGTGEWASLSGTASIITDRAVVSKYYSPHLKAWLGDLEDGVHDGSENDPRIGVIKIEAKTATYAISRSNFLSRGIEMVQGAITGNTAQVQKLREISESEIKSWRASH